MRLTASYAPFTVGAQCELPAATLTDRILECMRVSLLEENTWDSSFFRDHRGHNICQGISPPCSVCSSLYFLSVPAVFSSQLVFITLLEPLKEVTKSFLGADPKGC